MSKLLSIFDVPFKAPYKRFANIIADRTKLVFLFASLIVLIFFSGLQCPTATAAPLSQQPLLVKTIELGNTSGELKFIPDHLAFRAGQRYQLKLTNNSPMKHYFTAKDFADAIWSQKVDAGKVEIKGAIHELELRPETHAEWVFIPLRAGTYQLHCTIPGHTEAGMVGTIKVTG
jgi:uncharacterized cupredoxin-like copper-binding protein